MTRTARIVILVGTTLFTLGTVSWILTANWQWFAGGLAILVGTFVAGGILSVEVKESRNDLDRNYRPPPPLSQQTQTTDTPQDHDPFSS